MENNRDGLVLFITCLDHVLEYKKLFKIIYFSLPQFFQLYNNLQMLSICGSNPKSNTQHEKATSKCWHSYTVTKLQSGLKICLNTLVFENTLWTYS